MLRHFGFSLLHGPIKSRHPPSRLFLALPCRIQRLGLIAQSSTDRLPVLCTPSSTGCMTYRHARCRKEEKFDLDQTGIFDESDRSSGLSHRHAEVLLLVLCSVSTPPIHLPTGGILDQPRHEVSRSTPEFGPRKPANNHGQASKHSKLFICQQQPPTWKVSHAISAVACLQPSYLSLAVLVVQRRTEDLLCSALGIRIPRLLTRQVICKSPEFYCLFPARVFQVCG